MKQEALCLLEKYEGFIRIFTDVSKVADGGVAAEFYVQDHLYGYSERMKDSTPMYTAELAAVQLAINWLPSRANLNHTGCHHLRLTRHTLLRAGSEVHQPSKRPGSPPGLHRQATPGAYLFLDSQPRRSAGQRGVRQARQG